MIILGLEFTVRVQKERPMECSWYILHNREDSITKKKKKMQKKGRSI